jgi:hypothetical protein
LKYIEIISVSWAKLQVSETFRELFPAAIPTFSLTWHDQNLGRTVLGTPHQSSRNCKIDRKRLNSIIVDI